MKRLKIFLDSEFTNLVKEAELLSLGFISEKGEIFYAELSGIEYDTCSKFVNDNVIPGMIFTGDESVTCHFGPTEYHKCTKSDLRTRIINFLGKIMLDNDCEAIEIWSDCLAYDWVLFCDLFDGAKCMPEWIYYIPFDICTLFDVANVDPDINREEFAGEISYPAAEIKKVFEGKKHNALWDALVIRACYNKLMAKIGNKNQ